jgi:hypothetical protein
LELDKGFWFFSSTCSPQAPAMDRHISPTKSNRKLAMFNKRTATYRVSCWGVVKDHIAGCHQSQKDNRAFFGLKGKGF